MRDFWNVPAETVDLEAFVLIKCTLTFYGGLKIFELSKNLAARNLAGAKLDYLACLIYIFPSFSKN